MYFVSFPEVCLNHSLTFTYFTSALKPTDCQNSNSGGSSCHESLPLVVLLSFAYCHVLASQFRPNGKYLWQGLFLCLTLTTKHCLIDLCFKLQMWHDQKQHVALRGIKPASSTQLGFFSTWGGQHVLMPFCILICKFSSYHLKYFKLTCMDRSQEALPSGSSWYLWQWRVEVRVLVP